MPHLCGRWSEWTVIWWSSKKFTCIKTFPQSSQMHVPLSTCRSDANQWESEREGKSNFLWKFINLEANFNQNLLFFVFRWALMWNFKLLANLHLRNINEFFQMKMVNFEKMTFQYVHFMTQPTLKWSFIWMKYSMLEQFWFFTKLFPTNITIVMRLARIDPFSTLFLIEFRIFLRLIQIVSWKCSRKESISWHGVLINFNCAIETYVLSQHVNEHPNAFLGHVCSWTYNEISAMNINFTWIILFSTHILWHCQHSKCCSPASVVRFAVKFSFASDLYLRVCRARRCLSRYDFVVNDRSHLWHLCGRSFCFRSASFSTVNCCTLKFAKGKREFFVQFIFSIDLHQLTIFCRYRMSLEVFDE